MLSIVNLRTSIVHQTQTVIRSRQANTSGQIRRKVPSPSNFLDSQDGLTTQVQQRGVPPPILVTSAPIHGWWSSLASKLSTVSTFVNEWNRLCSFCSAQLLRTERNGWCCNNGKYTLLPLPVYPPEILAVFE